MKLFTRLFKKMEVRNRKKKSSVKTDDLYPEQKRSEIQASIMYCNIYEEDDLFDKSNIVIDFLASYEKISEILEYDHFKNIIDRVQGTVSIFNYSASEEIKWLGVSFNPDALFEIIIYENKEPNQFISKLIELVKNIPKVNYYIFGDDYKFINGMNLECTKTDNIYYAIKHYDNINEFNTELFYQLQESKDTQLLYLSTMLFLDNTVDYTMRFINTLMHDNYDNENFRDRCIDQMKSDYCNFTVGDKHLIIDYQYFTKLVPTISEYAENEKETFNDEIDEVVD